MFDRFTERARKALGSAKAESDRLRHEYIGTEHVLLGVVELDGGIAVEALRDLGIDPARIRGEIEKVVKGHPRAAPGGNKAFTPRAKRVLELAVGEATALGHLYVGSEHLLLGLIGENEGIAARVLLQLSLTVEGARAKVVELRNAGRDDDASAAEPAKNPAAVKDSSAEFAPFAPPKSKLRIGVIGAGGIVQNAHLPGYSKWRCAVSAIFDVNRDAAAAAAKKFSIANVCASAEELLARKDVDVVDVAIPESGRPAVLPAIVKAGKPTLLQKPLAYSLEESIRIVEQFERAKVPLAVNQNLRWSPQMRAAKQLIASSKVGRVFDLRWTMRNTCDSRSWAKGSWYSRDPRFQVLSWSIHHLDAFRFLLDDDGARVYCALPRRPDQNFVGDVCASAVIEMRGGVHVSMVDSNASTPGRPELQELDVDATGGSIHLELQSPRKFEYWLASEIAAGGDAPRHAAELPGEWYPDGFAGAMADFLEAIEKGREPSVSGRRNLGTMALVDACYRSAAAHQAVDVAKT